MLASADTSDGDSDDNIREIKAGLTKEFFSIGLPAFVQLAAEPLAALVDTVSSLLGIGLVQYCITLHRILTKFQGIPWEAGTGGSGRSRCCCIGSVCCVEALQ